MSAVLNNVSQEGLLTFQKSLLTVTNKIHSTNNVDEIMLQVSSDICILFNADRLTLYVLGSDKNSLVAKVKTGLDSFKELKLPIATSSIAGYVALSKKVLNIRDVYDASELKSHDAQLRYGVAVDQKTGYRSKQMLVAPILDQATREMVGVIQLINNKAGVPFGPMGETGAIELAKTLAIALRQREKQQLPKSKYDALLIDGVISAAQFEIASESARKKSIHIESVLTDEFQVKAHTLGSAISKFFSVPYEPFRPNRAVPAELVGKLKREYAASNQWLALGEEADKLVILCIDPERTKSSRTVQTIFPKSTAIYHVTTFDEFSATLNHFYGNAKSGGGAQPGGKLANAGGIDEMLQRLGNDDNAEEESNEINAPVAENELVSLVNKIIIDAYNQGASDIHIEPYPGNGKTEIRFRKDGSLSPYAQIPASYRNSLVARLKIMCDLDISEKRKPQDGKIKFKKFGPLDIELRVATIPSTGGVEDIVMRILAAGEPIPLGKLGLTTKNKENLEKTVSKPYGLFFVCGPTGSGKTTTLHSVLGFLNTPDTKIWTAEDPVEITQRGLRQVQINKKVMDFPMVMKAFLRADPDIIMVGEMRDAETTHIGIEASLTGHMVFATLHTNSAPEAITRLLDMGMDPFNFSDALLGILAQRLAKRLCSDCKEPYTPSPDEIKQFMYEFTADLRQTDPWKKDAAGEAKKLYDYWLKEYGKDGKLEFHRAKGCGTCGESGYKGRCGLHELMVASDPVKKLVQERARVSDIFVKCVEEGMSTLKMDGMEKVMMGLTDMKQVRAVAIK